MKNAFDMDLGKIAYVGKQGVLALLSESSFSENVGHTSPSHKLSNYFKDSINKAEGRVMFLALPTHIYTLQDIFTGAKATKDVFMQLDANAPDLIHISTHGFVDSNLKGASTPVNVMATLLSLDGSGSDEAMRRCGLLMAGANKAWITGECEPGQDDGILTAEEIATLDLSGCRMVVLSACETGLGNATDYEGVVGLQRAFKLAGVRTIVMSLWQVKDDVTALLMTRFYRHLLNDNLTPHEAMRRAQRDIRKDFPDPRDWAAFVVLDG